MNKQCSTFLLSEAWSFTLLQELGSNDEWCLAILVSLRLCKCTNIHTCKWFTLALKSLFPKSPATKNTGVTEMVVL